MRGRPGRMDQKHTLGVVKETRGEERRVGVVPESVAKLAKLGFDVVVERGAGATAGYGDEAYEAVGARIGTEAAWDADVVVKVRPPEREETARLKKDAVLVSLLFPQRNEDLVQALAERGVTAVALDKIPRISRAQKMDVLSSMANIAGYRAVLEAATAYEGFFNAAVTAAGTLPPAKVLVIGAGVAGLQAIAAARALGGEVRGFDVRPDCKEQVESLGATFLMVDIEESGEGGGGYAKTMSKEFIEAEMALFRAQAEEVDIIVTTALVPGTRAPILITEEMVRAMKPGSVVVDLAAEQGGNCEVTLPGERIEHHGVHVIGFLDLPSRMASTASRFFSGNIVHLLSDMCGPEGFGLDLENEVVRAATVVHAGEVLPPPHRPTPAPAPEKKKPVKYSSRPPAPRPSTPPEAVEEERAHRANSTLAAGLVALTLFALVGRYAPNSFVPHFTVFVLACFVGWQVVWSVTPALHTPLMSVTNAISGIILVGGMLQAGSGTFTLPAILGAVALLVASINVAGGFLVTHRMLRMFRKGGR
jgi:H+-translocating NAD(P) transhydrogenase subunit alpha